MDRIEQRIEGIRKRIAAACARVGRGTESVTLIGASKAQPVERLREAWRAGQQHFGENRVQEAWRKSSALPEISHWCLIGPLQSNKVNKAVELFESIHSIDRQAIALAVEQSAGARGRVLEGFLEVNLGGEDTKSGFHPQGLVEAVRPLAELTALRIVGLMSIPPLSDDPAVTRGWFRRLRELRDELFAGADWAARPGWLSMGMSDDFEVAIEEGATHVRVGTALFGPRPPRNKG